MKEIFKNRPLFTVCFFFSVSYAAFMRLLPSVPILMLCSSALIPVGTALVIIKKRFPSVSRYIMLPAVTALIAVGAAGALSFLRTDMWIRPISSYAGNESLITARIDSINYTTSYSSSFNVSVLSVNNGDVAFKSVLELPYRLDAQASDIITGKVDFSLPDMYSGSFPLRTYYASNEILITASASDTLSIEHGQKTLGMKINELSERFSAGFIVSLGNDTGKLASAVLLGKRSILGNDVKRDFNVLGISHLLAVSGLHISIVIGALELLLRLLHVNKWLRFGIDTVGILLFTFITGFHFSCIRAAVMLFIVMLASCLGRDNDSVTSLSFASSVILIFFRGAVFDIGFMLSVASTLGIVTLGVRLNSLALGHIHGKGKLKTLLRKLLSLICVSFSAFVFSLPVMWIGFGQFSTVSVLSNIIFVPLVTLFIYGTVICLIASRTAFAAGICFLVKQIGDLILSLASSLCRASPDPISLKFPFAKFAFAAAAVVLVSLLLFSKYSPYRALLASILSFTLVFGGGFACTALLDADTVYVTAVNRLKNDFLIINSGGQTVMCDFSDGTFTSPKFAFDISSDIMYDTYVDALFLTHLHSKHIPTFSDIAEAYHLKVLYLPNNADKQILDALKTSASRYGINTVTYSPNTDVSVSENFSLSLSETCFIKRSSQPIFYLTVSAGGKTVIYSEPAVFESPLSYRFLSDAASADTVFIGIHGPLIKKPLCRQDIPESWSDKKILVTSPLSNEQLNTGFRLIDMTDKLSFK